MKDRLLDFLLPDAMPSARERAVSASRILMKENPSHRISPQREILEKPPIDRTLTPATQPREKTWICPRQTGRFLRANNPGISQGVNPGNNGGGHERNRQGSICLLQKNQTTKK
mgnify:CR=1 FL=1